MEGKKFSSSRGVEILVRDFLSRYDPDALRYFLSIAGPETQDTDFTWSEFVRRNNDELVATWGNLVNRTLQSAYKNFGAVPEPGALTDADEQLLARGRQRLRHGRLADRSGPLQERAAGDHAARRARQPVRHRAGAVGAAGDAIASGPATILYVALRAIDSLKVLLTPFLPFSSQRLHELLGYDGVDRRPARVPDGDGGRRERARRPHRRLRGRGSGAGSRARSRRDRRSASRSRSSRSWMPRHGRRRGAEADGGRRRRSRRGVTDSHAHLDACDEPAAASSSVQRRRA